jgi:hypothetical protein
MITPKCNEWPQAQEARGLTIFDIIPDKYAILVMDHHDRLLDACPIRLIGKPGGIIQGEFLEEMLLAGKKETGILTA